MKLLFDFLPILLFFATFRFAESNSVWATHLANTQLAPLLPGGAVAPEQVPVLLATLGTLFVLFTTFPMLGGALGAKLLTRDDS